MKFTYSLTITLLLASTCHSMGWKDWLGRRGWGKDPKYLNVVKVMKKQFPNMSEQAINDIANHTVVHRKPSSNELTLTLKEQEERVMTMINNSISNETIFIDNISIKELILEIDALALAMGKRDYLNYIPKENRIEVQADVDKIDYTNLPKLFVNGVQEPYADMRYEVMEFCNNILEIYAELKGEKISTVDDFDRNNRLLTGRIDKCFGNVKDKQKEIEMVKGEIMNLQARHEKLMKKVVGMQKTKRDEIIHDAEENGEGLKTQYESDVGFLSVEKYLERYRNNTDAMNHFIFSYVFITRYSEYSQENNSDRCDGVNNYNYDEGTVRWKKKNGDYFVLEMSREEISLAKGLSSLTAAELTQWTKVVGRTIEATKFIAESGDRIKGVMRLMSKDVSKENYVPSKGVAVFYGIRHYITHLREMLEKLPQL